MRDLSICRNCPNFFEHEELKLGFCGSWVETAMQDCEGVRNIELNIGISDEEYQSLKIPDDCNFYTEQFISECCHAKSKSERQAEPTMPEMRKS